MVTILSIDGGGIRGIIPAGILTEMERILQEKTDNDRVRLADYFDMIAGVSTGGIISALLLHPHRYGAQRALQLYVEHGRDMFDGTFAKGGPLGLLWKKYRSEALERKLAEELGECKLSDVSTHCLIPAYDIVANEAVFFTRFDAGVADRDYFLKDVARATSAAPTYFNPAVVMPVSGATTRTLVDGGVFANNPVMLAITEAAKTHTFEGYAAKSPSIAELFVVSLGTGEAGKTAKFKKIKDKGGIGWLCKNRLIDVFMHSAEQAVHSQAGACLFEANYGKEGVEMFWEIQKRQRNGYKIDFEINFPYFRINPKLNDDTLNASEKMDNVKVKNIRSLQLIAEKCCNDYKSDLEKIVDVLIKNKLKIENEIDRIT